MEEKERVRKEKEMRENARTELGEDPKIFETPCSFSKIYASI